MKVMKNIGSLSKLFSLKNIFFFFVVSCGSSPDGGNSNGDPKPEPEDGPLNLTYATEPEIYGLEDPNCLKSDAKSDLGVMSVWRWAGTSTEQVSFDFGNTNGFGLENSAVSEAVAGYHQVDSYSCKNGCDDRPYSKKTVGSPNKIKICRRDDSYLRDSAEGVALSMLSGVSISSHFYKSIKGHKKDISSVSLNILPHYEKIYHDYTNEEGELVNISQSSTDNAYWKLVARNDEHFQLLEVLPHSKGFPALGLNDVEVRLWEVPMVLGHEYGHHVFYNHAENLMTAAASALKKMGPDHFGIWHDRESNFGRSNNVDSLSQDRLFFSGLESEIDSLPAEEPKIAVMLMPILEGFADLFGHYSQGDIELPFENIKCLGINRDVSVDRFGNKTPKVLTTTTLERYMTTDGTKGNSDCNIPSAGSYYSLGAILAYGVHRLMSADDGAVTVASESNSARKGAILLKWIEKLNAEFEGGSKILASEYFHFAIDQLLELSQISGKLSKNQCSELSRVFPFYKDKIPADSKVNLSLCDADRTSVALGLMAGQLF